MTGCSCKDLADCFVKSRNMAEYLVHNQGTWSELRKHLQSGKDPAQHILFDACITIGQLSEFEKEVMFYATQEYKNQWTKWYAEYLNGDG